MPSGAPSRLSCRSQAPRNRTSGRYLGEDALPDTSSRPASVPVVDGLRRSIVGRHVAPPSTCLQDMEDAADHAPIVDTGLARLVVRQMRLQSRPGLIRQPEQVPHALLHAAQTQSRRKSAHLVSCLIGSPTCLIPGFDGALFSLEWKDALWARFSMGAPARQRQSVERYSIVKRA